MHKPALFLYTSWRTGGTAIISAFKADPSNMIFYDPLNAALSTVESARIAKSDNWNSNHPPDFKYFEEYLPLFEQGTMGLLPNLSEFKFANSSAEFKDQLVRYIGALVEYAHLQGKLPVFKLEQLKGHVNLLRENFPQGLHVGFVRNPNDQFHSWLEQLALGDSSFFDGAVNLINSDRAFFKSDLNLSKSTPYQIFEFFHSYLVTLRPELDFTHNLYDESFEDLLGKIASNFYKDKFILAIEEYKKVAPRISTEKKFIRMTHNSIELIQQRDEIIRQRDEIIRQRDEIIRQRDELMNSTIWKSTKPFRALINFLKR